MSRWQPQVTQSCLESWIALILGESSGSNHRVSLSGCFRGGQKREKLPSSFREQMQNARSNKRAFLPCLTSLLLAASPPGFRTLLHFLFDLSRLSPRLTGFSSRSSSQRQVQRPRGRALNLCLLITPPWVSLIFIFLVPRSFARINFQSSAFKGFSRVLRLNVVEFGNGVRRRKVISDASRNMGVSAVMWSQSWNNLTRSESITQLRICDLDCDRKEPFLFIKSIVHYRTRSLNYWHDNWFLHQIKK